MHHAALGGYLDLIVKMAQNGGSVRKMDEVRMQTVDTCTSMKEGRIS